MKQPFETFVEIDCEAGHLEDVPAEFDLEIDKFPAEPFSHGGSRGEVTEVTAHLRSLRIGGLDLDVHQSIKAFGPEAVSYTHLRAHETDSYLVCRLLLEK